MGPGRMGVASLMARSGGFGAPPSTMEEMHLSSAAPTVQISAPPLPVIMTTDESPEAAAAAASDTATMLRRGCGEDAEETTPLNRDEKETRFGGSVSGTGLPAKTSSGASDGEVQMSATLQISEMGVQQGQQDLLNPVTANSLALPGDVAGAPGGTVSSRVRRVSMAMSIASEGKNVRFGFAKNDLPSRTKKECVGGKI
jgi:hypothetical protein